MSAYDVFEADVVGQKYASLKDLKRLKKVHRNLNRSLEEYAHYQSDDDLFDPIELDDIAFDLA